MTRRPDDRRRTARQPGARPPAARQPEARRPPATSARAVALRALQRIEHDGAYANLALPPLLASSGLDERDRRFATELVYGTTRMRRACDFAIDRFVLQPPDAATRTLLRLGAYQLLFGGVSAHAAVDATVTLAPQKTKGFVNAILRRVAKAPVDWPDDATRLSYPTWIVDRLVAELGHDDALAALARMNEAPVVTERDDGYVQDASSQWVAELVGARSGELIADLCAAPGGKATAMAAAGATVIAADVRPSRVTLLAGNTRRLGGSVHVVAADGTRPPFRPSTFDRVLLDAPCSGLGVLRRRADARWRIEERDVTELAALQRRLLEAAAPLVRPGGTLVYSVCTSTAAESTDHPVPEGFAAVELTDDRWRRCGDGVRILPQDNDTDGMTVRVFRRLG